MSGSPSRFLLVSFGLLTACGGSSSSPAPPSAPSAPPQPATWTLSGTLTETLTGAPIAGAVLDFWQMESVTTDSSGRWTVRRSGAPSSPIYTEIKAAGYIERRVYITWTSGGRSEISADMIRESAPFSLAMFRKILRNDLEEPGVFRHLRRWTVAPNFYINAFNPRTGRDLIQRETDEIVSWIRNAVPQATGGRFEAGLVEVGSGARPPQANFIGVEIVFEPTENYCGRAEVGSNPGRIWLNYELCVNYCRGYAVGPRTVTHEVGHAMGLWHHDAGGIMAVGSTQGACADRNLTELEKYYARLLYARPPGNADLDWDQRTTPTMSTEGPSPIVTCYR